MSDGHGAVGSDKFGCNAVRVDDTDFNPWVLRNDLRCEWHVGLRVHIKDRNLTRESDKFPIASLEGNDARVVPSSKY